MSKDAQNEAAPAAAGGKPVPTVSVSLKKSHTHRGIEHIPGTKLDLRPDQARRLIDRGIADAA